MSENKNNSPLDGREIPALGAIGIGAVWYKYGYSIQMWFHENMVTVVLGGITVLVICGYVLVRRFQKKNEEEIARMRRLSEARPQSKSPDLYYQRRREMTPRNREQTHE